MVMSVGGNNRTTSLTRLSAFFHAAAEKVGKPRDKAMCSLKLHWYHLLHTCTLTTVQAHPLRVYVIVTSWSLQYIGP